MVEMPYSYQIDPISPEVRGGWKLRLFKDDMEIGGGDFPLDDRTDDAEKESQQWYEIALQIGKNWLKRHPD